MNLENKEQYENIIGMLSKTLEFYANEINYRPKIEKEPPVMTNSKIQVDGGEQARFILKQIKSIEKNISDTEYSYDELIKNAENNKEINPKDIIDKLTYFKNEGTNNKI